jgi:transposase
MVYAQVLQKNSIKQLPEWFDNTTICETLQCEPFSTKDLYESLTHLEAINFDDVEAGLISFWRHLAPEDDDTVVLDVTDTYFSGSTADCKPRRGKDGNISRLLQIGLIVSFKNGFPLLQKIYEGNIPNVKIFEDMLLEISNHGLRGIIMDRGFFSKDIIEDLKQLGMHVIVGVKQTKVIQNQYLNKVIREEIYTRKHQVILKETIVYTKTFDYLGGKLIVIYNPSLEVLKRDKMIADKEKGEGIKYVGYSLVYHNTDFTEASVVKKYFEKDIVERAFKTLKGPLSLRPIRVWLRRHVEAHVKICYLAMCLITLLDYKSRKIKISGIEALKLLKQIYKVQLKHSATHQQWEKVVTMSKSQRDLLKVINCSV